MAQRENPLRVHGVAVVVIGVVMLLLGVVGTGRSIIYTLQSAGRTPSVAVPRVGGNPLHAVNSARSMWYQAKRYLSMGWLVIAGTATAAAGVGILKRKEWARLLGFGGAAFAALAATPRR